MTEPVALPPRRDTASALSRVRRSALRLLLALATVLTIAAGAAARTPEPVIAAADSSVAACAASAATAAPCGVSLGAAEIEPDGDAGDAGFGSVRPARRAAGPLGSGRVSYRAARVAAATPLALGSPLRPPRESV